jgi:DNA end-binding protein Ku
MMPSRAIWSGAIAFGLVTVPVKLFSAVSRKSVRFHQLNGKTGVRIQQKRVDPSTGDEVPYEDIVKGFELTPDRYVVIEPGELEALDPKKTRAIEIVGFVALGEIDPIYYDHPYYLAPAAGGAKTYKLLLDAMRETNRVAIATVVIRSKQQLVAVRPMSDSVLGMATMVFPDEIIDPSSIEELEAVEEVVINPRELEIAQQLIDSLAGPFDPDSYRDTYRDEVLALVERKAQGEQIAVQPHAEEDEEPVPDLMSALKASLDAVRSRDDNGGDGDAKKPAAKKPATTKKTAAAKKAPAKKPPPKKTPSKR